MFAALGVLPECLDDCVLGIPEGWRAFATRVYEADAWEASLEAQHAKAVAIRGSEDVLFYGTMIYLIAEEVNRQYERQYCSG